MAARIVAVFTLAAFLIAALAAGLIGAFAGFGQWSVPLLVVLGLALDALLLCGVFERRAPIFGRIFWRGPRDAKVLSLTFDDGPNEPYTSQVLDLLKASGISATFFVLGENARRFPDAVRRALEEGHEIGNHGYDHTVLPLRSSQYIRDQIARTADLIERIAGARPRLFRAPHGWRNPWFARAVRSAGCIPVAWTLGVWDTDRPGRDAIVERSVKGLAPGCLLLLHDGRGSEQGADASQMVEALPAVIERARAAGYSFLTVSGMMEKAGRA
ncbi:MAG TPA: polysaccharide deacetylase family protein [bacterium]|nr:polysaccharide deacetylase family protein [bacterium]